MEAKTLRQHYGHDITIARYGDSYALECETCNEVLTDTEVLELEEQDD